MVHTVSIVHPGTSTDRYGNVTKDWTTATRTTVKGWIARQSGLEDRTAGREAEVSTWYGYLPAGTPIAGGDRLDWEGVTFEVDGPPYTAWSPRGPHHTEIALRIVTG
jgi:hypothetical protein